MLALRRLWHAVKTKNCWVIPIDNAYMACTVARAQQAATDDSIAWPLTGDELRWWENQSMLSSFILTLGLSVSVMCVIKYHSYFFLDWWSLFTSHYWHHRHYYYEGKALRSTQFLVAAPFVWNNLPRHLRNDYISPEQFAHDLKTVLFARAYSSEAPLRTSV